MRVAADMWLALTHNTETYDTSPHLPGPGPVRARKPSSGEVIPAMHRSGTGPYSVHAAQDPGLAHPAAGWRLCSELVFGALPGAVPCARLHSRLVLFEWGQGGLADSVELVVSELMTNALRAAAPTSRGWAGSQGILAGPACGLPSIGFRMASDQRQVLIEVWDGNPAPPLQGSGPVGQDSESGRGLLMVQQVSRQWGYYYPAAEPAGDGLAEPPVKVVWALVAAVR